MTTNLNTVGKRILVSTALILCLMLCPIFGTGNDIYAASANDILSKAKAQDQKKISSFPSYFHSGAWCVDFVWWCANQTTLTDGTVFPSSLISNTRSFATWFTQKGNYTSIISSTAAGDGFISTVSGGSTKKSKYDASYTPKAGDIAFFRNSNKNFHHVAIVMSYNSSTDKVTVVHGNWNASTNPRVVAGTVIKARTYDSSQKTEIAGYARPAYSAAGSVGTPGSSSNSSTETSSKKTYTVKFNAKGGTVSTSSKKVTSSAKYGTLPKPARTGYSFGGWYTKKSGGSKISAASTVKITATQTLYAKWYRKGKVTTKSTALTVRSGAGSNYKKLGSLAKGKTVALKGSKGSWYKITFNGKTGYISKSYVKRVSTKTSSSSSTVTKNKTGTVNISSGSLNMRKGPGTSYAVVKSLKKGAKVTITGTSGSWYKIKHSGSTGYVSKSYIKL